MGSIVSFLEDVTTAAAITKSGAATYRSNAGR